jgi:hypothetical protein
VQKMIGSYHFNLSFLFAQSSMSAPDGDHSPMSPNPMSKQPHKLPQGVAAHVAVDTPAATLSKPNQTKPSRNMQPRSSTNPRLQRKPNSHSNE